MLEFEWDTGNLKHIIEDYPSRENTIEEVESLFTDQNFVIKKGKIVDEEQRFTGVGIGINQIVKIVVFVIRENKIRPISCWTAKQKIKDYYYENNNKK